MISYSPRFDSSALAHPSISLPSTVSNSNTLNNKTTFISTNHVDDVIALRMISVKAFIQFHSFVL